MRSFFADSDWLDYFVLRPLSHISMAWELTWDAQHGEDLREQASFAGPLNELVLEIEACQPPLQYHDNEDRLAEYVRAHLKWPLKKVGRRWLGANYDSILEQGGFDDVDQGNLILAAAGRIKAARDRGQLHFDKMASRMNASRSRGAQRVP
jgi:hypothetical protein